MSTEESAPPARRRSSRKSTDETKSAVGGRNQKQVHRGDEILFYDAESWEDTKEGIRKIMRTIEVKMGELTAKLNGLLKKYEECQRMQRLVPTRPPAVVSC